LLTLLYAVVKEQTRQSGKLSL